MVGSGNAMGISMIGYLRGTVYSKHGEELGEYLI